MDWSNVKSLAIPEGDVKAVAIGGVTVWTKPNPLPYDAEVEYLYNSGGRYIDTGFTPTSKTRWEMRATFLTNNAKMGTDPTTSRFRWIGNNTSIGFDISSGSGSGSFSTTSADYHDFVVDFTTGKAYVDNASKNVAWGSHTQTLKMFLFASNTGSGVDSRATRLYWCKIYDNGILVRDFIPVRVGSGANAVGYLYDRANPTGGPQGNGLYANAGTGAFVAGPDKTT